MNTEPGFVLQRGEPGIVGHEGLAWLSVNLVAQIQFQQMVIEGGLEGGEQLLPFLAVQVAVFQWLIVGTGFVEILLAARLDQAVQAIEVALFGGRLAFGYPGSFNLKQVLTDLVEIAFDFVK
ncbi:hypothetical protein D3C84_801920 [compost metagenome]